MLSGCMELHITVTWEWVPTGHSDLTKHAANPCSAVYAIEATRVAHGPKQDHHAMATIHINPGWER